MYNYDSLLILILDIFLDFEDNIFHYDQDIL